MRRSRAHPIRRRNSSLPIPAKFRLHAEGHLGGRILGLVGMHFCDAAHDAVMEISDRFSTVLTAPFRIGREIAVVDVAQEPIAPAVGIKAKEMILELRDVGFGQRSDPTLMSIMFGRHTVGPMGF